MAEPRALDVCDRVLDTVLATGGDSIEAEVTVVDSNHALTRFANSFIHQNVAEDWLGVRLRVLVDGRVAGASTTVTDDDGRSAFVERTLAAARLRPEDPDWPGLAPPAAAPDVDHYDEATEHAAPGDRAAVVRAFVVADTGLRAAGYCEAIGGTKAFASTAGQRVTARSSRATLDGVHQVGETFEVAGKAHQTSWRLADLDGAKAGTTAARLARDSVDAVDLDPGHYEVVLSPECTAEILSFLASYGFNAKQVIERQSFVKLGSRQFDPAITIVDDVTHPEAIGVAFDAEGTPKRRVELVSGGECVGLAHDRRTARKTGAESTGHAVPGGEAFGALPSNLFLLPGETPVEEMVAAVDRGLLVTEFNYCRVLDPKTQVVTGLTRNGTFLVEGGKVAGAVKNLRFTQSFVEALAPGAVKALGNDARFATAEFGAGGVHAPSLHLTSFHFTGGARG